MSEKSQSSQLKKLMVIGLFSRKILPIIISKAPGYFCLNIIIKIIQIVIPLYQVYLTTQLINQLEFVFNGKSQWSHAFEIILIQSSLIFI